MASSALARRCRHSPCTGMTLLGRTALYRNSSSPAARGRTRAPSRCPGARRCAPSRARPLTTPNTAVSLPGISELASTTVSPGRIAICRCSPRAIRDSADSGSPCEPVDTNRTSSVGQSASPRRGRPAGPSGTSSRPRSAAMPMLRTIDRPTKRDLAAVRRGDVEHLLDAVHVAGEAGHDDPLGGLADHVVQHRADVALGGDESGHLGVGGVDAGTGRRPRRRAGRSRPGR